jgi:hypothetical protein
MKYAIEMDSVGIIYIPDFIKTCSDIQKLIKGVTQTHRQQNDLMSLLYFFNKESRLKMVL